ncbi:MAG: ATP-binding cassette domain-containing protein [Phycisphaerae bacterium]
MSAVERELRIAYNRSRTITVPASPDVTAKSRTMNVVEIENVTKTFGQHTAVDSLSLSVPQGSIYGFIGPNGSGKTTTLRMIMRIHHPDPGGGHIRVLDEESFEAANDRIGYLPEERGLYKKMKVRDILRFYAELKGRRNFKHAVNTWLERTDLTDWANKKVETLSKGMAQKVQFISAVIAEPELVILDEPFTGLDPVNMDVLREAVLDLRRRGSTIIFSTHDMAVAERMCDFIFMIFKGGKVLDGTLESIQNTYGQDTVRVKVEGNGYDPHTIPGVEKVTDFGTTQELRITPETDTQELLSALMKRGRVAHFELTRPSLHDIFVRIAGPEATEDAPVTDEAGPEFAGGKRRAGSRISERQDSPHA